MYFTICFQTISKSYWFYLKVPGLLLLHTTSSPTALLWATIIFHLYYCCSFLPGLPAFTLAQHTGHSLRSKVPSKMLSQIKLLFCTKWLSISLQIITESLTVIIYNLVLPLWSHFLPCSPSVGSLQHVPQILGSRCLDSWRGIIMQSRGDSRKGKW